VQSVTLKIDMKDKHQELLGKLAVDELRHFANLAHAVREFESDKMGERYATHEYEFLYQGMRGKLTYAPILSPKYQEAWKFQDLLILIND
jgi:hypothetical protein